MKDKGRLLEQRRSPLERFSASMHGISDYSYRAAFSKRRVSMRWAISWTVSFSCLTTAWPFSVSTVKECVSAGVMTNATTVVVELAALSFSFKPKVVNVTCRVQWIGFCRNFLLSEPLEQRFHKALNYANSTCLVLPDMRSLNSDTRGQNLKKKPNENLRCKDSMNMSRPLLRYS